MTGSSPAVRGEYKRVRELAHGGMGTVDLVVRAEGKFRRLHAVKRMHPHLRRDADLRAMFLDEARIAGLLSHPNVVSVVDYGEDEDGPFLVMDYIEGVDLADVQIAMAKARLRVPIQIAVRIVAAVARGLHAAHELADHDGVPLGLVHRDLSPQNVLLSYDGVVRVTDFGIAKAVGRTTRTSTGVLKGKMGYMAPEQLKFEDLDRRSDLYPLGIVLYELLAGRRLHGGKDANETARKILHEPPPDIGEVRPETPPEIVDLLFELLAKSRDDRPASAADVARRLDAILVERLADEEPLELSTFVEELFGEQRDRERVAVAAAVAEALTPAPTAAPLISTVETPVLERPRAPARRSAVTAAFVLGALAIGAASTWALTRPSQTDAAPAAAPEPESNSESDPVPVPVPVPVPDSEPDPAPALQAEPTPTAEPAPAPAPTRRARHRTRRRQPTATTRAEPAATPMTAETPAMTTTRSRLQQWEWTE